MKQDIVYVQGSIISETGFHFAKEFTAFALPPDADRTVYTINGDYILNRERTTESYYQYCASGDIIAYGMKDGVIACLPRPIVIHNYFKKGLKEVQEMMGLIKGTKYDITYHRMLYIECMGCLELFLSDMMISLILGNKDNYDRFCSIYNPNLKNACEVFEKIREVNCHNIQGIIHDIFNKVLQTKLPELSELCKMIITRHDLVHRKGFTKKLYYDPVVISDSVLNYLIDLETEWIDSLYKNLQNMIEDVYPEG